MILTYNTDLWLDTASFFSLQDIRCLRQTCHELMRAFPYTDKDMNARSLGTKLRYHKWAATRGRSRAIILGCAKQIFGESILYKRVIQQAHPRLASTIEKKMEECMETVPSFGTYLQLWNGECPLPAEGSFERHWLCLQQKPGIISFLLPKTI